MLPLKNKNLNIFKQKSDDLSNLELTFIKILRFFEIYDIEELNFNKIIISLFYISEIHITHSSIS